MKPLLLTLREMERLTGGRWRGLPEDGLEISGINFYLPYVNPGDLFVCLTREATTQGHAERAVDRAFKHGAVAALVPKDSVRDAGRPLLEVADPDKALQDMAAGASLKFDGTRVLVTGSHGKTGFKNQLYHLIRKQTPTHAYLESANKERPVMRALASLPQGVSVAIVEVAVPARNIGQERAFFVRPDYCVITGIGPEHLKSHGTMENLVRNKAGVVAGLRPGGRCLLNGDDPYFPQLRKAVGDLSACPVLVYGSTSGCEGRLIDAEFEDFRWHVRAEILGELVEYDLSLLEHYAPLASVGVLLQAKLLGADVAACVGEYADYRNFDSSGKLYRVPVGRGAVLVYDQTQRGELKGFESTFELMSRLHPQQGGRKIAVLSEFINLEDNPGFQIDIEKMRALMASAGIDLLFTVNEFERYAEAVPADVEWRKHGKSHEDIRESLLACVQARDMVFLRGVLASQLGKLTKALLNTGNAAAENIY
ncbi:MAG: Mur ligase family protein [Sulfurisoma sp.]|nr:Mur ligase family protein [Sulfurisoma sp.]